MGVSKASEGLGHPTPTDFQCVPYSLGTFENSIQSCNVDVTNKHCKIGEVSLTFILAANLTFGPIID